MTGETLGIVLAFAGLAIFFFFGATKIYGMIMNQESDAAKGILTQLNTTINSLESGKSAEVTIQGIDTNEKKMWYLAAWSEDDLDRPDVCFFNSCLCICKGDDSPSTREKMKANCQNGGLCEKIRAKKIAVAVFVTDNFVLQYISLPALLKKIKVEKIEDAVWVTYSTNEYLEAHKKAD